MRKRIFALILSFIYCGLGHIYMGRIGKGFNLALIYSLLIASYLFSESSFFLRGLNLLFIALMWIMGMVDSSVDYKFIKWGVSEKWRRLQPILSLIVIVCAIITLLVPHILDSFLSNEHQETGTQNVVASLDDNSEAGKNNAEATSEANSEAIAESNAEESIETNTANLYNENVAIVDYSIKPVIAETGTKLTIEYIINSARDIALGLGFSIQRVNTHKWVSDVENDKVVEVSAGRSKYSRDFVLPTALKPGEYNVICGLWDSDYAAKYYSRESEKALNVVALTRSGYGTDNSDLFSVQVATFRKAENAEKLRNELLSKGYPARIEYLKSSKKGFYIVLVGEAYSKENAAEAVKELQEYEGYSGIVIRRYTSAGEKLFSDAFFRR